MNLYLEEVVEETKFFYHLHRQKTPEANKAFASTASQSDPEDQWSWLLKVMEEAKKKGQNVSTQTVLFRKTSIIANPFRPALISSTKLRFFQS
jgi:hypothetical protein